MAPKATSSSAANRRKSGKAAAPTTPSKGSETTRPATPNARNGPSSIVTLKIDPQKLLAIVDPSAFQKEESPVKDSNALSGTNGARIGSENPSDSNTPAAGTPSGSQAAPANGTPVPDPKKRGIKRGATGPNGDLKPRGKPGPKKKARLEDGTIDPNAPKPAHKLGPKANQGAINAGLRALDRTGKPTRKWSKGTFKLKSFTGEIWELSRWRTQPRARPEDATKEESSTTSATGSNKENKETLSQEKSDNAPSTGDVEMKDAPASFAAHSPGQAPTGASTPMPAAPVPVAAS